MCFIKTQGVVRDKMNFHNQTNIIFILSETRSGEGSIETDGEDNTQGGDCNK